MIRAGIIGAAGYTAGELLRILVNHPDVEIAFASSGSHAGEPVWKAHQDLFGDTDIVFSKEPDVMASDVVFICSGHGKSAEIISSFPSSFAGRIIDLSQDFRLSSGRGDFVYGLPEAFRASISAARHIANPGCFATAIELALLPAAKEDILTEIHATAVTGSTGAGQKLQETTSFSWRSGNLSVYKAFSHQHLLEITETLSSFAPSWNKAINFVPVRGDFPRGIMASVYFDCPLSEEEAVSLYTEYYSGEPFTFVTGESPDMKMAVGTNKAFLNVRKYGSKLHIVSVIDNLCKGASGQAVQNMNLMFGLEETEGLKLKAARW